MTLSLSRSLSPGTTVDNGTDPLLEKSPKKFRSTNTWLETKKIQNALEEKKTLLEERRVEKLAQLSQGEWIPSSQLVKVTKQVGRHWATMGHTYLGELYLDPEEALFLLEANTIEIYFNGLPMSLQQAYSVLLNNENGCTLEEYRAFSHLTRFGYKVRRHRPEVGGRPKINEPLEIDVVGVIRKRKSCDTEGRQKFVEIEDAIEVVDSVEVDTKAGCSGKDLPSPVTQHLPYTSQVNNAADDDDIKFLEIVDTSKKRKVLSSVVIHDDIEISLASNGNGNDASAGQSSNMEHDIAQREEDKSFKFKAETIPNISLHSVSDCELELVEDCNDNTRPSRGMYQSNLFTPATSSSQISECVSSMDVPSTSHNNCRPEAKPTSRSDKIEPPKVTEASDDVIVLSDDETKGDGKQAKELLKFYKEISLIELIDISEEDEEGKAAVNSASGAGSGRIDENYDFWGVLGRIPTLESGRLIIRMPAPPSQLIPLSIQPFRDEYVVSVTNSGYRPCEGENANVRQGSGRGVRIHEGERIQGGTSEERCSNNGVRAPQERPEGRSDFSQGRGQLDRRWIQPRGENRVVERNSYLLPTPQMAHPPGNNSHQWHPPPGNNSHQWQHPLGNNSHHWQNSPGKSLWNQWMTWNHHIPPMNYYSNPNIPMNFWGNNYQASSSRSLWSSLVYSERQVNSYPMQSVSQQWASSNVPQIPQCARQMNYQNYGQNTSGQSWVGNRTSQWQGYSSSSHGSRSGGRWQRQSGLWPRRMGSRHYSRGGRYAVPYSRRPTPQDMNAQDKFSASVVPKVPHAQNWSELKIKSERNKPGEATLEPKPEVNKDSKNILPLVKPSNSISIDAVQSKLQITSSGKDNYYNGPENYKSSLSIKYDLYMPNSSFKKSCPGLPKYRLSIMKSEDRIPKLKDTWYLTKDLNDEVPLLFAVSFTESVNFFSFSNVELPAPLPQ